MRTKSEDRLREIVLYIDEYYGKFGKTPSLEKMASQFSMAKANVYKYVSELETRGLLENLGRDGLVTKKMAKINKANRNIAVVGEIACGSPMLAEENIEEYVSLPEKWVGKGEFFILRAKGESMINAGINEGDLVLVRKQVVAEQGQIVVALTADGEATLKRFYLRDGMVLLHPENDEMEDIVLDYCDIQGVVAKVIKDV
ncbi:MAG: transcriptional repressor LexA [Bacillota bacterium]